MSLVNESLERGKTTKETTNKNYKRNSNKDSSKATQRVLVEIIKNSEFTPPR